MYLCIYVCFGGQERTVKIERNVYMSRTLERSMYVFMCVSGARKNGKNRAECLHVENTRKNTHTHTHTHRKEKRKHVTFARNVRRRSAELASVSAKPEACEMLRSMNAGMHACVHIQSIDCTCMYACMHACVYVCACMCL
jgi:hypothetical protein